MLNAAFATSASFALGSHLAYTMVFDESFAVPIIVGKLISGVAAVLLALLIYKEKDKTENSEESSDTNVKEYAK